VAGDVAAAFGGLDLRIASDPVRQHGSNQIGAIEQPGIVGRIGVDFLELDPETNGFFCERPRSRRGFATGWELPPELTAAAVAKLEHERVRSGRLTALRVAAVETTRNWQLFWWEVDVG
jgi:hypothetical protein